MLRDVRGERRCRDCIPEGGTKHSVQIAEVDLELRGPGEMIGTRQSGIPAFKYANLIRDRRALEVARTEADRFLRMLRTRPDEECRRAALVIRQQWKDHFGPVRPRGNLSPATRAWMDGGRLFSGGWRRPAINVSPYGLCEEWLRDAELFTSWKLVLRYL